MERIQLFKVKKLTVRFLLIGGVFSFLFGVGQLIFALIEGFRIEFPVGDLMSIFFIIQGIIFCIWAYSESRKSRYFISLDKEELKYLLPKQNAVVSLAISEIDHVKIDGIEISIHDKTGEIKLRLEYIEWQQLKRVKLLVEDLSLRISQNNV
jgi:hypothetical protein